MNLSGGCDFGANDVWIEPGAGFPQLLVELQLLFLVDQSDHAFEIDAPPIRTDAQA